MIKFRQVAVSVSKSCLCLLKENCNTNLPGIFNTSVVLNQLGLTIFFPKKNSWDSSKAELPEGIDRPVVGQILGVYQNPCINGPQ